MDIQKTMDYAKELLLTHGGMPATIMGELLGDGAGNPPQPFLMAFNSFKQETSTQSLFGAGTMLAQQFPGRALSFAVFFCEVWFHKFELDVKAGDPEPDIEALMQQVQDQPSAEGLVADIMEMLPPKKKGGKGSIEHTGEFFEIIRQGDSDSIDLLPYPKGKVMQNTVVGAFVAGFESVGISEAQFNIILKRAEADFRAQMGFPKGKGKKKGKKV